MAKSMDLIRMPILETDLSTLQFRTLAMRSVLSTVGAFCLLLYGLVMTVSLACKAGTPPPSERPPELSLTPRSTNRWLRSEMGMEGRKRRVLRTPTIGRGR